MNLSEHKIISHPSCMYCCPKKGKYPKLFSSSYMGTGIRGENMNSDSVLSDRELLQRLRGLEDQRTGIVTRTEKLYDPNRFGINFHHFYGAMGFDPLRIGITAQTLGLTPSSNLMSSFSSGSGFSPMEAKTHALMEFVERYSNMIVDESRIIWKTYNDVEEIAINPTEFVLYGDKQYRKKLGCSRFSPDTIIPWIEGRDLYTGKSVLIGADFVYYPAIRQKPLVMETSNGAAAHSNLVQAILNGLYEVIERDAFLVMWLNALAMPILELKNLPFSFNESIRRINDFGLAVKLVDLTNDTKIPTVMAVCYNKADKYPQLLVGAGCHIDPQRAIQKALFEMELLLNDYMENPVTKIVTNMNKFTQSQDHVIYYMKPGMRKHWHFMISSKKTSNVSKLPKSSLENNHKLLDGIVRHLHKMNHRIIWVNITPPDIERIGLKVVKVFITGFQPLYSSNYTRLSLERLSEVPARLGYNSRKERNLLEINKSPHPLS